MKAKAKTGNAIDWKKIHSNGRKRTRALLDRIAAVQTNGPNTVSEEMDHRLLGAEQALLETLAEKNYVEHWLAGEEKKIIEFHATLRKDCGCGVCRRKQ